MAKNDHYTHDEDEAAKFERSHIEPGDFEVRDSRPQITMDNIPEATREWLFGKEEK